MKSLSIVSLFASFALLLMIQSESISSNCSIGAVNIGKILIYIQENLNNIPICDDGFVPEISGDSLKCVQNQKEVAEFVPVGGAEETERKEEAPSSNSTTSNVAPNCPSFGCPQNPICKPGDHLLSFAENCCCVKEDVFKEEEESGPTACPPCSLSQPGHTDCECVAPLQKFDSIVDPKSQCCFLPGDHLSSKPSK